MSESQRGGAVRCPRKDRDTAISLILGLMSAHRGGRLKPSGIAAHLGLGRERTAGLLAMLRDEGRVGEDGGGWFLAEVGHRIDPTRPSEVRAWLEMGRELFGCPIKITLEVT